MIENCLQSSKKKEMETKNFDLAEVLFNVKLVDIFKRHQFRQYSSSVFLKPNKRELRNMHTGKS